MQQWPSLKSVCIYLSCLVFTTLITPSGWHVQPDRYALCARRRLTTSGFYNVFYVSGLLWRGESILGQKGTHAFALGHCTVLRENL